MPGIFDDIMQASRPRPRGPLNTERTYGAPLLDDIYLAGGNPRMRDDAAPPEERLDLLFRSHARARTPVERVMEEARRYFPQLPEEASTQYNRIRQESERERRMHDATLRTEGPLTDQDVLEHTANRFPVISPVMDIYRSVRRQGSRRRIEGGSADDADYDRIARYEQVEGIHQRRREGMAGWQGMVEDATLIPGMIAEFYIGATALRAAAAIPRVGGALARIGLGTAGTAAVGGGRAGQVGAFGARALAQTAVMPGMYVPGAIQNAEQDPAHGDFYSLRNLPPAAAIGTINTAILGSIGNQVRRLGGVRGFAQGVGVGMGEQALADVGISALGDAFGYQPFQHMRYGLVGDWGRVIAGMESVNEATRHSASQALTFGAFGLLHRSPAPDPQVTVPPGQPPGWTPPPPVPGASPPIGPSPGPMGPPRPGANGVAAPIPPTSGRARPTNLAQPTIDQTIAKTWAAAVDHAEAGPDIVQIGERLTARGTDRNAARVQMQEAAILKMEEAIAPLTQAIKTNQAITRAEALAIAEKIPEGPYREHAIAKANQLPEAPIPGAVPEAPKLPEAPIVPETAPEGRTGQNLGVPEAVRPVESPRDALPPIEYKFATRPEVIQEAIKALQATGVKPAEAKKKVRIAVETAEKPFESPQELIVAALERSAVRQPNAEQVAIPEPNRLAGVTENLQPVRQPNAERLQTVEPMPVAEQRTTPEPTTGKGVRSAHTLFVVDEVGQRSPELQEAVRRLRAGGVPEAEAVRLATERMGKPVEPTTPTVEANPAKSQLEEVIRKANLTPYQEQIIRERFLEGKTLDEIAAERGVKRQAIEQAEKKAREKMGLQESAAEFNKAGEVDIYPVDRNLVELERLGFTKERLLDPEQRAAVRRATAELTPEEVYHGEIQAITNELLKADKNARRAGRQLTAEERAAFDARVADATRRHAERGSRAEVPERETPVDQGRPVTEGTPDITGLPGDALYHTAGSPSPRPSGTGGKVGPFEIIATQNKLFDNVNYVEKRVPGSQTADAAALLHSEAIVTQKMSAGDPHINLEENAHIFSVRNGFPADPKTLPADVSAGLHQFWDASKPLDRRAMLEGFAQWFVKRSAGELVKLTPQQEAANRFAEAWIGQKGFTENANRIRDLYTNMQGMTKAQQAAALLSATGKPAEPIGTGKVKDWWTRTKEWIDDYIFTDLGVLHRMQKDAKEGGYEARIGEDAVTVFDRTRFADKPTAGEFITSGVHTLKDGKKEIIGQPLGKPGEKGTILETLTAEDLAPLHGDVSKASVYAIAKHVIDEASRAGMLSPPHPHAKDSRWVARERQTVSPEQLATYRDAMADFQKDPAFVARAEEYSRRLTDAFNATRRALASPDIHMLDPDIVAYYEKIFPTYVELGRVISDTGWKTASGSRGENTRKVYHERSGSGEQIVDPLVSYQKRLLVTAALLNEQIRRNSVVQYLLSKGMGDYGLAHEQKMTPAGEMKLKDIADRLGLADHELGQALKELGPDAVAYFTTTPWPTDGTKATYHWRGPNGEPTTFHIKERALYDLITGQQGDANTAVVLARAVANLGFDTPWGRVRPLQSIAGVVRKGATLVPAFQIKNAIRDPQEFFKNTIDQTTVKNLPEFFARSVAFEVALAKGDIPKDVLFELYKLNRGDDLRLLAFDKEAPASVYDQLRPKSITEKAMTGTADILRSYVNIIGAGENAPRALEFRTFMEKHGWTEARLAKENPPWHLVQAAMFAAGEVTTPFQRQGILTREINKIQPFFGANVAGLSKSIRNWRVNPKGAAIAMSAALALRLLHWITFKDEEWYKDQTASDRFNNYVLPVPGVGPVRFPGGRALDVPVGGALITMLDAASRRNPDFAGLVRESIGANAPSPPLTPLGSLTSGLMMNSDWQGRPIVPRRDDFLPASHNLVEHQGPYALQQLTGGRGDLSLRGLGLVPFSPVRSSRTSDTFYETLHELASERALVTRRGQVFPQEREYDILHDADLTLRPLRQELNRRPAPTEARQQAIRSLISERVRSAMQRLEQLRSRTP